MTREEIVSSGSEELILVDDQDQEIGSASKIECHEGSGILHRAFSIFVFNSENELLLQQRSGSKPLWPLYWSNTCCSHPRRGETMDVAVSRRLRQELGFECELTYLYKFMYQAQFGDAGAEREFCSVYFGYYDGPVDPNVSEIAAWRLVDIKSLNEELAADGDRFSPWFKLEWAHIQEHYLDAILARREIAG
ncbi:MAG TPA: isopentenyl-diphosphate Delta-isomerase [Gammaproteobacteria bacterium]|jgi:isopentenyl-diphosphate delta-isomerase